jgi:hypothetical protein
MRHIIGFTKKLTDRPFHVIETEGQASPFTVGQFVKVEPSGDWLQILQIGTQVYVNELYTTVVVGDPPPAGSLSDGENWSDAADWSESYRP